MDEIKVTYMAGEIKAGDTVEYLKRIPVKGKRGYEDVPIYGTWDGTKVQFTDDEKIAVHTVRFLRKCKIQ